MDNNEIKRTNRKALPKFILLFVVCALIGGVIGYFSGKCAMNELTGSIKAAGAFFGTRIAPWLMLALAVIVPAVCVPIYRCAKKLIDTWDGEDEELADIIDGKISTAMWISSAALVISYFLIAASYSAGFAAFDSRPGTYAVFASIVGFLAIMVETIVIQQKCVDAAKHTNPVKDVSVYDMKFQKKWVDSCDEAEKIMIGKCAYKAYTATGSVCAVLAIVLAVCALVFGIGFLPSLVVCLIWLVNLSVYCREAMRCSKAGIKIP